MLRETDGTTRSSTLTPVWKLSDYTESRRIILQLTGDRFPSFMTGKILLDLEKIQGMCSDLTEYSENVQFLTFETKAIRELMSISLLSQVSFAQEVKMTHILSRLLSMKVAGIRGTAWIAFTLLNMHAPTPSSRPTPIVSPGPDAWRITNIKM